MIFCHVYVTLFVTLKKKSNMVFKMPSGYAMMIYLSDGMRLGINIKVLLRRYTCDGFFWKNIFVILGWHNFVMCFLNHKLV